MGLSVWGHSTRPGSPYQWTQDHVHPGSTGLSLFTVFSLVGLDIGALGQGQDLVGSLHGLVFSSERLSGIVVPRGDTLGFYGFPI